MTIYSWLQQYSHVYSSNYVGFQVAADRYFIYLLTLFLTTLGATGIAFFISAGVTVAGIANLLVALSFVLQMVSVPLMIHDASPNGPQNFSIGNIKSILIFENMIAQLLYKSRDCQ